MSKEEKQRLKDLSKSIQNASEKKRLKRQQDIERILDEFKGIRNIPGIKTAKKRVLITKNKEQKSECITSRKGIADAFGEFNKRLYEDSERDDSEHEMSDDKRIPEITTEELQSAISKLKTGKSPDSNGIRAEDIKACDDETREMMGQLFNEIIKRNNFTPDEWKKVKFKVSHKEGDVEGVSNYRPICSLPTMYKLFSTILYGRFFPNANLRHSTKGSDDVYDVSVSLTGYEPNDMVFSELGDSQGPFSCVTPSSDQDIDDATLGELLTEAHRGHADHCDPEGVSVSQSSMSVVFDRTGKLVGENSSNAQIRTLLDQQRQMIIAE